MKQSRKMVGLSSRLSHNPALTDLRRSTVTPSACQGHNQVPCSGTTCYGLYRLGHGTTVDEEKVMKKKMWGTQVLSETRVPYLWQHVLIYCYSRKL